jgi:predicted nucleotidyltransferase
VIVFGSRVRGTHDEDSDWDVAVVSPDFQEMRFPQRQRLIRRLVRQALGVVPLDVVCYTPEEYEAGQDGLLPSIIEEEGVRA